MSVVSIWRTAEQRYRLTGSVDGDGNLQFPPRPVPRENRNLGAAAAITRDNKGEKEVFVLDDSGAKFKETAGDLPEWSVFYDPANSQRGAEHQPAWSLPGGGRQLGEGIVQTLLREVNEELHILIQEQEMLEAVIGQVALYFAAQYSRIDSIKPNIFAVRAVLIDFQQLSAGIRSQIDRLVEGASSPQAKWVDMRYLAELYELLRNGEKSDEAKQYRPHTLAAAYIRLLEEASSSEELAIEVEAMNMRGFQQVVNQSPDGYTNGAFGPDGRIRTPDKLRNDEADFLYGDLLALQLINQHAA